MSQPDQYGAVPSTGGRRRDAASESTLISRWLVGADRIPEQVVRDRTRDVALLPTGRRWEAVRVPGRLGQAVIARGFARSMGIEVGGWPVICDPAEGTLSFLVPVGTGATWAVPDTVCLSDGPVPVPAPTVDGPCMAEGQPVADSTARCDLPVPHWPQPPLVALAGDVVLTVPVLLAQGLQSAAAQPDATTARGAGRG